MANAGAEAAGRPERLRVGLAGAGMISWYHLAAWKRVRGAEVVALCDPVESRVQARAREYGIRKIYPNASGMLDQERLDAVDIATPVETHDSIAKEAAARGVHILCQKPLAPTLLAAEALVAAIGTSVRLMVHENWRFRPYYRQVAAWIASGQLGRLQQGSMSVLYSGLLPDSSGRRPELEREPTLRSARRLLIGGLLIHHLDVMRWLLGPLSVVAARAASTVAEVEAETTASILLETLAGAPIIVVGNMAAPGFPTGIEDRLELIGSEGTISLQGSRLELRGARPATATYELGGAYQAAFDGAIQHFVDCLRSGHRFETDAADNLETLRLVEASYAAAGLL